jgi:hypothetical protein
LRHQLKNNNNHLLAIWDNSYSEINLSYFF